MGVSRRTGESDRRGAGALWAVVLAGGDGRRLAEITRARYGYDRPKQFCDFGGGALVSQAIERARRIVPAERIVVATTAAHRREADECLGAAEVHRVEQPSNRGTTPGILLPLLAVLEQDPGARVVLLPSDHGIADEAAFMGRVRLADQCVAAHPERAFLLGVRPEAAEDGYGWVVSRRARGRAWHDVAEFHEKPGRRLLDRLWRAGAHVNTFMIAAQGSTLLQMVREHARAWFDPLIAAQPGSLALADAYARLPMSDFSRDVLTPSGAKLGLVPVGGTGWTDLGTPDRLRACTRPLAAACG